MPNVTPNRAEILDAIRLAAQALGQPLPKRKFFSHSGITEYHVLKHFPSWKAALKAAGILVDERNVRLGQGDLLQDWGNMVRENREIPTRHKYRREGHFSANTFATHFGPWSVIPDYFRKFATDKPEWADVVALLPMQSQPSVVPTRESATYQGPSVFNATQHPRSRLDSRQTYGNPIDFRGLRHEPTNENGVIFLFGMVAKELGYNVEAVQSGFPDCEAKRQIAAGKWQRVRIEFEYESRNFRDHGHPFEGCDVLVCWRHNWADCPSSIEILELGQVIRQLSKSDD